MSYVFVQYDHGEYEYFKHVKLGWDDASLILTKEEDPREFSWLALNRLVKVEVSEYPRPEIDEKEDDDERD